MKMCIRDRDFPVRVDLMSRFRTPAEMKKTIEDLKKGLVDIVIGTHRVLSKDVKLSLIHIFMRAEFFRIRSWFPAMITTWTPGMVENR